MKLFQSVQQAVQELDAKSFRNYVIAFFVLLTLIMSFMLYRYYSALGSLNQNMNTINNQREQIKEIAIRYNFVQKQQDAVETLLKQDPKFKIIQYFGSVLEQHGLTQANLARSPEASPTPLDTDHTEVTLVANLVGLNMKTIAELLDTLERKERIYTKDIEIIKPMPNARTVNLNLTIATLEPTAGKPIGPTE